jgi:hypothetical protein
MPNATLRALRAAVGGPAAAAQAATVRPAIECGPWGPPGAVPGDWGRLAPPCGHPGEADALVMAAAPHHRPVALLRRRWHAPAPGDPDAAHLDAVPLYELISPGGRDVLSAMTVPPLLDELARRLGITP